MSYRHDVLEAVRSKSHLIPLFSSTYHIPERVREYGPRFFVVYNSKKEKFEIHHLDQQNTYCLTIPYKELDVRALQHLWENDLSVHGTNIFRRVEQSEERMKQQKDREWKNWIEDVAKETRSAFAKDAWTEV